MSTHESIHRAPWEQSIAATGGTLNNPHIAASFVRQPYSWPTLQDNVRKQIDDGFVIIAGGFEHIHASGTRWLASEPNLWWDMHSASIPQLKVIQACSKPSELILGALARQGHWGNKTGTPGKRGPSVVKNRWNKLFPVEMSFVEHCMSLDIGPYEGLSLWKSSHMQENIQIQSQELSTLLGGPDLR